MNLMSWVSAWTLLSAKSLAVLAIDLDLFNRVNNSMGHAAGDAVLSQLAERIKETLDCVGPNELLESLSIAASVSSKGKPMLARLGADTFIIARPGVDRNSGAIG
jgi:GGDEF domain-containing protein